MSADTYTVNEPVPFEGTKEEKEANRMTHYWITFDGCDYNCSNCDCKPWHAAAEYPCGTEPPRQTVVYERTS